MANERNIVREYEAALVEVEKAADAVNHLVAQVNVIASAVRDWKRAGFINCGIDVEVAEAGAPIVDGSRWPAAPEVARAVSRYRRAAEAAAASWEQVPKPERRTLRSPLL